MFENSIYNTHYNDHLGKKTMPKMYLKMIISKGYSLLLSAADRRGTPVLLSASVSDNSGNSSTDGSTRRSCEIDQSTQRFHVGCDNRCNEYGNEYGGLHGREFLCKT